MVTDLKTLVGPHDVETTAGTVTTFYTTKDFLDCDCEEDYIHRVSDLPDDLGEDALQLHVICRRCGTLYEDAPDSRANEVLERGLEFGIESLERHGPEPFAR